MGAKGMPQIINNGKGNIEFLYILEKSYLYKNIGILHSSSISSCFSRID